ncbi:MAG: hypothetical protein HFH62_13635 [Lachnospiraceae bacterium]|nr:hypothetical protein [Lachnospiraceae bacterium]
MDQRINPLNTHGGRQSGGQAAARQRASANVGSSAQQAGRTIGSRSDYAITRSPSALHVGDTLRGEITDLRNNEISITLEDNTTIRAQIPESSNYSIGQMGTFRLSNIAGSTLYLENISIGYNDTELSMINKALEEAGLPATDHNQAAVKALMDNLLPINRTSIQNLMQQSYDYHTEDMNTLAVMNRLMMKMDEETVSQFSNYRNNNHAILEQIQNFSLDLPSLLHALADNSPADAMAYFGKSMLSTALNFSANEPGSMPTLADLPPEVQRDIAALLSKLPVTEDVLAQIENRTLSLQDAMTLIRDGAVGGSLSLPENSTAAELAQQLNHINQALEPNAGNPQTITEDYVKNAISLKTAEELPGEELQENGEASQKGAEDAAAAKNQGTSPENRLGAAGKFLQSLSDSAKNTLSGTLGALRSPKDAAPAQTPTGNHSLDILAETYEKYARNGDILNSYLSQEERNELLNHLQNLPISRNTLLKVASGEATTKDILTVIYNTISLSDSEQIKSLFQSQAFEKLFARELQSSWTLTPEQLQKGDLSEFYNKMRGQLESFRNLIQSSLSGSDSENLSGFARDMESNISFMKTLNETFSYFQLPLKLPSQDAHGDLYVYTQKEKLRQHPEKNSVLLHLNLDHLGEIDVRIERNKNDVITNFSLNDDASVNLFRTNGDMLKNALNSQGYSCQIQVQQKEDPSPTMDDFINTKVNTHATTEMKRFSFDIRA